MRKNLIVLTLIAALMAAVSLPGFTGTVSAAAPAATHSQSHPALFDKTRFLLHMGVAFYAFHHFVYKPFKDGAFKKGASGRIHKIIFAGLALLFAYHEAHVAYGIAKGSSSKTLHALISPIGKLQDAFNKLGSKFHGGNYSDADVTGLTSSANGVQSQAQKAGYNIIDRTVPIPGLSG